MSCEHMPSLPRLWVSQWVVRIRGAVATMCFYLVSIRADGTDAVGGTGVDRALHWISCPLQRNLTRTMLAELAHILGCALCCFQLVRVRNDTLVARI
jgi:hypothetical protein